jgi:hypothetical protein
MTLANRYPDDPRPVVRAGRLRWTVRLTPTPLSVTYTVRIDYVSGQHPTVTVLDPPLRAAPDTTVNHVFERDELCLYYDEFDCRRDLLADTVLPWISEWLYHHEHSQGDGTWHGGGLHPDELDPDASRAVRRRARRRTPDRAAPSTAGLPGSSRAQDLGSAP